MKLLENPSPTQRSVDSLVLRVVSETPEFNALKNEWNALVDDCPDTDFFISWAWMYSWWTSASDNNELRIYVVRDNKGNLRGLLPCTLQPKTMLKWMSYYQLGFIGAEGSPAVYYQDLIARPRDRAKVSSIIIPYLVGESAVWDLLQFDNMPTESPLTRRLPQEMPGHRFTGQRHATAMIELPPDWNHYLSMLDSSVRDELSHSRERFSFQSNYVHTVIGGEHLKSGLSRFAAMPRTGGSKAKRDRTNCDQMYAALSREKIVSMSMQLHTIERDERMVAGILSLGWKHTQYCLEFRTTPAAQDLDAYRLLVSYAIEQAISDGYGRFDLLGGERVAKKLALTGQSRDTVTIGAYRDSRIGRLLKFTRSRRSKSISASSDLLRDP